MRLNSYRLPIFLFLATFCAGASAHSLSLFESVLIKQNKRNHSAKNSSTKPKATPNFILGGGGDGGGIGGGWGGGIGGGVGGGSGGGGGGPYFAESFTATPPFQVVPTIGTQAHTTLAWDTWGVNPATGYPVEAVEIHVGAPNGPAVNQTAYPPDGKLTVPVGGVMVFYLQDASEGPGAASSSSMTIGAVAVAVVAPIVPVPMGNYTDFFKLVNVNSSKCLDRFQGAPGAPVYFLQLDCFGSNEQNWKFVPMGGGFEIVNQQTGLCLDVPMGNPADGQRLQEYQCLGAGDTNQLWQVVPYADGYEIVNMTTGKCLDMQSDPSTLSGTVNFAQLQQYTCFGAGARNQLWNFYQ